MKADTFELINKILTSFAGVSKENVKDIFSRWNEPWRFYHGPNHLQSIMDKIKELDVLNVERNEYILAAIFHDVVYLPWEDDNERKSVDIMREYCDLDVDTLKRLEKLILSTANIEMPRDEYSKTFWKIDNDILLSAKIDRLMEYERQIRKEFQFVDYSIYREERMKFLKKWVKANIKYIGENTLYKVDMLGAFIRDYKPKIGVYAGSFNPFHVGHLNILEKAEEVFDKVIIAIGNNPNKNDVNYQARVGTIKKAASYRQVESFSGLLTDYMKQKSDNAHIYLVRGLRNGHDLDYEENQLWHMSNLSEEKVKTVCFLCDNEFKNISSSSIRGMSNINDDKVQMYIKRIVPGLES